MGDGGRRLASEPSSGWQVAHITDPKFGARGAQLPAAATATRLDGALSSGIDAGHSGGSEALRKNRLADRPRASRSRWKRLEDWTTPARDGFRPHLGAGWCAVRPKSPPTMQSAHPQRQHPRETRLQVFQAHFVLLRVRDDRDQVRQQRLEMRSAAAAPPGFTPARRQSVPAAYGDAVRSGTARAVSRHCGATAQEARARRAHRHRRRGGRTDGGIASGPVPRSARMLAAGSRATTD